MKVKALMMMSHWSRWLKNHQLKNSWSRQSRICWKMPTWRKLQWSRLPDRYVISKHLSRQNSFFSHIYSVETATVTPLQWLFQHCKCVNVIALTKYQTKLCLQTNETFNFRCIFTFLIHWTNWSPVIFLLHGVSSS